MSLNTYFVIAYEKIKEILFSLKLFPRRYLDAKSIYYLGIYYVRLWALALTGGSKG